MHLKNIILIALVFTVFVGCKKEAKVAPKSKEIQAEMKKKEVVYQVFTR